MIVHYSRMADTKITDPFVKRLAEVINKDPSLTVAGLALRAGLTNSAIRLMISRGNQSPKLDTARKICKALGVTLEEFLSDAQTEEEREIVRLVSELPADLRQKLLGYGQGLAASLDRDDP